MLVSKAGGAHLSANPHAHSRGLGSGGSYAPLYLTTSLRNIAFDIEVLEQYALDRLRLLKAVDSAKTAASIAGPKSTEWGTLKTTVRKLERQHDMHVPTKGNTAHEEQVLKDEASHFILRLALCREFDTRSWLLGTECTLFGARLEGASTDVVLGAVRKCGGPTVTAVSKQELEEDGGVIQRALDDVARGMCRQKAGASGTKYFRVGFEQVPILVKSKRVFLKNGEAYVPERNVQDVVTGLFRSHMNQSLTLASKAVGLAEGDRRMRPILESVRQHYAADEMKSAYDENNTERIGLKQLNESVIAMPLCMQTMLEKLRDTHHLRYQGRLQLGVFLKGCGLTMEESLHFWKTEFGRGDIDASKFEKTYAYNIRHQYGKEGKRRNLTPFACIKVINERPGPIEYHGCPYRELPENALAAKLSKLGIENERVGHITAKAKEGNYNAACGMCFRATQPIDVDDQEGKDFITTHPNEYFIEARRRRLKGRGKHGVKIEKEEDEDMDMPSTMDTTDITQTQTTQETETQGSNANADTGAKKDEKRTAETAAKEKAEESGKDRDKGKEEDIISEAVEKTSAT